LNDICCVTCAYLLKVSVGDVIYDTVSDNDKESDYGNVKISKPVKKVTENTILDKLSTISLAVTNSSIISALLVAPQLSISFWFDGRYNEPVMLANGHL